MLTIYGCGPVTARLRHDEDSAALPLITDGRCRLTTTLLLLRYG
jgi:hypothetical protein